MWDVSVGPPLDVAHIYLNLIVKDSINEIKTSIVFICNAISYICNFPLCLQALRECVEKEKIQCKCSISLDHHHTRWNSIYIIFQAALQFEKNT